MSSRARAALIGTLTAILSFFGKSYIQNLTDTTTTFVQASVVVIAAVVLTMAILILDWVISQPYVRSVHMRFLWDRLLFKPFLEGFWTDVGIDKSGPVDRIVNCSFISIIRTGADHKITGRTWSTTGTLEYSWESVWMVKNENPLDFWYRATRPTSAAPQVARAKLEFSLSGPLLPDRYSGEYADIFRTEAQRVQSIDFFKLWARDLPEEKKKKAAREYLFKFAQEQNFDPDSFTPRRSSATDMREAYFTFLRLSNQKEEEKVLVDEIFSDPANRKSIKSILDLGPGEGLLTSRILQTLASAKPAYTGVDLSGALLDDLGSELSKLKITDARLIKQNIESFLPHEQANWFDLVVAFNSLYYVGNLDSVCKDILRVLRPGGRFVALHTDIKQMDFLRNLIGQLNAKVHCDVNQRVEALAAGGALTVIGARDRTVAIQFPELNDAQWAMVMKPGLRSDPNVGDTANLISFLLDARSEALDEAGWEGAVKTIKAQLPPDGILRLPIKLQLLQKSA